MAYDPNYSDLNVRFLNENVGNFNWEYRNKGQLGELIVSKTYSQNEVQSLLASIASKNIEGLAPKIVQSRQEGGGFRICFQASQITHLLHLSQESKPGRVHSAASSILPSPSKAASPFKPIMPAPLSAASVAPQVSQSSAAGAVASAATDLASIKNKLNTYKEYLLPTLDENNVWGEEMGRRGLLSRSNVIAIVDQGASYRITIKTESEEWGEPAEESTHSFPKEHIHEVVKALEEASKQPPPDFSRPE
jgi:hypothetical protein